MFVVYLDSNLTGRLVPGDPIKSHRPSPGVPSLTPRLPQRCQTGAPRPPEVPPGSSASHPATENLAHLSAVPPHSPARALLQPHVLQELIDLQSQRLLSEPPPAPLLISWASPPPPQRRVHRSGPQPQEAGIGLAFRALPATTTTPPSHRHLVKGRTSSPAPGNPVWGTRAPKSRPFP